MKSQNALALFAVLLILATILLSLGRLNPTGEAISSEPVSGEFYHEPPFYFYSILVTAGIILLVLWYYFNSVKKEFHSENGG